MIHRLILIFVLAGSGIIGGSQLARGQGSPLYPDLQTLPPSDLFFDRIVAVPTYCASVIRSGMPVRNG